MDHGFGKRDQSRGVPDAGRGGTGIKTAHVSDKTGKIVMALVMNAKEERDLMAISINGQSHPPADQVGVGARTDNAGRADYEVQRRKRLHRVGDAGVGKVRGGDAGHPLCRPTDMAARADARHRRRSFYIRSSGTAAPS